MFASNELPDAAPENPLDPQDAVFPPPNVYSWDFTYGLGPWTTWLPPAVVTEPGGTYGQFTRLQAPGPLDANHIDGVGAIWLVAHLSTPTQGSPGVLNLVDAEFEMTVRGTDFLANGGKLAIWLCRYVPETGLMENVYFGLQVTNWANTGGDMMGSVTDEWTTVTLRISDDPADWTYAGNYETLEGDWADRYQPFSLTETLSRVDATLHLVVLNEDPDNAPTGFLDLANITVRTQTPATPIGYAGKNPEVHYGVEDQHATGTLHGADDVDPANAVFTLVNGSARNGTVTIDPDTGAFVFTPPANYFGPTDAVGAATFSYTVSDGVTTSAPINVIVYVGGINDAPVISARPEAVATTVGRPIEFSLFKGDDIDGDVLTFELVDRSVTGGVLTLDSHTGRYTFVPSAGYAGPASFIYRVSDGHTFSAEKRVDITVHPTGQAPALPTWTYVVDNYLLAGDMERWVYYTVLLANNGDDNASYHYGMWLNAGANGVTRDKDGARAFLEDAAQTVPDARLILSRLYTSGEGGPRDYARARELLESLPDNKDAIYRLAILDHLGYGAPVDKARAVEGFLEAALKGQMEAAYALGRRYLDGEGVAASAEDAYFWLGVALKFNAPPGNQLIRDLLTFNMVEAATGLTAGQKAALDAAIVAWDPGEASPVNDAPSITGEDVVGAQAGPGQVVNGVLGAASDPDGDGLAYVLVGGSAQNGTVTINASTGAFTFNPAPGYSGMGSFSYVVTDGRASSAPRNVTIAVEAGTSAVADAGATDEAAILSVGAAAGLLANDFGGVSVSAVEGAAGNVGQSVAGDWGALIVQANGSYVFTPGANARTLLQGQRATDTFTYTISNAQGLSSTATLTVTINGRDGTVLSGTGVLVGTALGDEITGGEGRDTLIGLDGDDYLSGGSGADDEMYGGKGDDRYLIATIGDTIVELAGEGSDTVETALSTYTLRANVENLTYVGSETFRGVGTDVSNIMTGGQGRDVLIGLAGNDVLIGGSGVANELHGGLGDDAYLVSVAGDTIVEREGEGFDTVKTTLSTYTLRTHVEALTFVGAGSFTGIGTAEANVITGGAGADVVHGRGGVDRLVGGGGLDTASYANAAARVDVRLNTGTAVNDGDGATDVVVGIENLTGSAFNDLLVGDAAANVLTGGAGRDTLIGLDGDDYLIGGGDTPNELYGGRGNDRYLIATTGDSIIELAGEGSDTVETALSTYTLRDNVENLTYIGSDSFRGVGTDVSNIMTGGHGRDVLIGLAGNDVLIGGSGVANELHGGHGDDAYVVSVAGDTIVERAGEGFDTVKTTLATYTLRTNVEALTYVGSGSFTGIGTAEANAITGGGGADVLHGRGGVDRLVGGAGLDTASYANAAARVDVRLYAGVAINDGDGATDELSEIENLTGSAFDDLLVGDGGANVLTGGLGRDTLLGMGGDDRLIGGSGVANQLQGGAGDDTYVLTVADTVVELAGEGIDTVETTLAAYALRANVENLTFTGTDKFAGTGNELANLIRGGLGADTLKGGGGDDTLAGGGGRDVAVFSGLQAEYQIETLGNGQWRVTDLVAGRDGVDLLLDVTDVRFGNGVVVTLGATAAAVAAKELAPLVLPEEPSWLTRLDLRDDVFAAQDHGLFLHSGDGWELP